MLIPYTPVCLSSSTQIIQENSETPTIHFRVKDEAFDGDTLIPEDNEIESYLAEKNPTSSTED